MKKLYCFISVMVLFMLYGCAGDSITDTYWRNDKTGDWLIGLTEDKVIYDCKVWDITSKVEKKDTYTIEAKYGEDKLSVNIGNENAGKRTFTINNDKAECSIIGDSYLPDYPQKDTITTFADNHYVEGDSVTIKGWIKPSSLPGIIRKIEEKLDNNVKQKVEVRMMAKIITDEEWSFTASIDSLGCFTLRMPIENTASFYLDCGRGGATIVAEPNETYFLAIDPSESKTLFMGKNARLQNEINAHNISIKGYGADQLEEIGNIMDILDTIKTQTKAEMQELEKVCREHPTLSERYRTYYGNEILIHNAHFLMQGMYLVSNRELPEEYTKVIDEDYWKELAEPYTMEAYNFTHFFNDYSLHVQQKARSKIDYKVKWIMDWAEKDGIVSLSAQDREAISQYDLAFPIYNEKMRNAPDSMRRAIDDEFIKNDFMKVINEITSREGYQEYARTKFMMRDLEYILPEMNGCGWTETAQDLFLCRYFIHALRGECKPFDKTILDFADGHIHMPAALNAVHALNDKYEELSNLMVANAENFKSNDAVKGMTDGEQIFRKMIEPYKGKIVLVDIWGTWCGPCKERLSHSQEEYERLKDIDMVYLYLANSSSDESWKNVIKEYNVLGRNVVHYNLPNDQQKAVEKFLNVQAFPTYKLIDRQGSINDLDWRHADDLDAFAQQLESMK